MKNSPEYESLPFMSRRKLSGEAEKREQAKRTAFARGFSSVKEWMKENRKAHAEFSARVKRKGEDKHRLQVLMRALDKEHDEFSSFI